MRIKPLPPLNSLVAFEAAARHSSFTVAAAELCVTQGAVSRQIRHLEEYLGKSLFHRVNRGIELTVTGHEYYRSVRAALGEIAEATAHTLRWKGDRQITVATTNAMAALWLLPKIPGFQRDHEDVDIRILASDHIDDLGRPEFDFALLYCRRPPPHLKATPLFPEEVFPVCSPTYRAAAMDLQRPEELFAHTLLDFEETRLDWFDWPEWFRRVGVEPVEPRNRIHINNYPMLIQAAVNGQGIALAWGHLLDHYLDSGALVRPVDTVVRTPACFYLLEPQTPWRSRPSVRRFRDWLLAWLQEERGSVGEVAVELHD